MQYVFNFFFIFFFNHIAQAHDKYKFVVESCRKQVCTTNTKIKREVIRGYKFSLSPTVAQSEMIEKHFGCARFVYNWGLNKKIETYKTSGASASAWDLLKELTQLKKTEEYSWLSSYPCQITQTSMRLLENAFNKYISKKANRPTFKKKKNELSCQYSQKVRVEGNKVRIPKIGWIRYRKSREILGDIKLVTISKTKTGKYYVSIQCDTHEQKLTKREIRPETSVGIDLGVKYFAVTSDGEVFENQKYIRSKLARLRVEHRKLQRCKNNSKRKQKQRVKVAMLYEKIVNQRCDYLHKFTTNIVGKYDTIVMEDLSISNMVKNHNLSSVLLESGLGECNRMFEYKCDWYGKNFIKIGRFEPSSKRCHECGHINKDLRLRDREWVCPNCGAKIDRDFNAALNIRDYGLGVQPSDAKMIHKGCVLSEKQSDRLSINDILIQNSINHLKVN